ncbi:MAG TPA: FAD-binding oxidoreductase [Candidatus Baltobacteraceae bacterium]|nr:FAD-binding oxidoreductase [Candidatus Baltobacteraceae bacterium]
MATDVRPQTIDEAAETLAEKAARNERVGFFGGGTALDLGCLSGPLDAVVHTENLTRTVEYAPADLIITVEAGMTLVNLQRITAAQGQRLALDPPLPDRATIGGMIAVNASGPRRARFGTLRDLVIGMSFVRADGALAHGGGRVVKNVAGFDLPKLMIGSLGTLGMVATVTFRLHPAPEVARWVRVTPGDARGAFESVTQGFARQLEPSAWITLGAGEADEPALFALFEGFEYGVTDQMERFAGSVRERGGELEELDDAASERLIRRHDLTRSEGDVRLKMAVRPRDLPTFADALKEISAELGAACVLTYPSVGIAFVSGELVDSERTAAAIERIRTAAESVEGSLVLERLPETLRGRLDVWGRVPASSPIMQALKDRFDPDHRMNPGRFIGGW